MWNVINMKLVLWLDPDHLDEIWKVQFQSYHLEELGFFDWTSISPLFLQTIDIYCFISGASFLSVVHRKKKNIMLKKKIKKEKKPKTSCHLWVGPFVGLEWVGTSESLLEEGSVSPLSCEKRTRLVKPICSLPSTSLSFWRFSFFGSQTSPVQPFHLVLNFVYIKLTCHMHLMSSVNYSVIPIFKRRVKSQTLYLNLLRISTSLNTLAMKISNSPNML